MWIVGFRFYCVVGWVFRKLMLREGWSKRYLFGINVCGGEEFSRLSKVLLGLGCLEGMVCGRCLCKVEG